tara:strand:+ start:655 stop:1164 length:510 start_codon:yes stop_codon:yes gene_type:complete
LEISKEDKMGSKLRETFKNIKDPVSSNNYGFGGKIIEGFKEMGRKASELTASDWKDIILGFTGKDGKAPADGDIDDLVAYLAAGGGSKEDSVVADSVRIDAAGFASTPQSKVSLQKASQTSPERFVGEDAVQARDISTQKIAQINEVLGKGAYTQVAEGPRVGRNINIG